jgi:hypothetical protein
MTLAKSMWLVASSSEDVGAAPCAAADRQKRETVRRSDPHGEAGPNLPPNLAPVDTFADRNTFGGFGPLVGGFRRCVGRAEVEVGIACADCRTPVSRAQRKRRGEH